MRWWQHPRARTAVRFACRRYLHPLKRRQGLQGYRAIRFLFTASTPFFAPLDTGVEGYPLMATAFVHCIASKRCAPFGATILPAPESFSLIAHLNMFLQFAMEFASVGNVIPPSQPIRLAGEDKLVALRRIDKGRLWNSLDDQLYCTICKSVISGRQIEVVGGTNGLRALHLKCSTADCLSTPADWILPVKSDTVREIDILFRDNGA